MKLTIALAAAAAASMVTVAPAFASWHQPYGGCEEATLAPHSVGAQDCRAHGWTIRRRLAVNPHAVVKGSGLPDCREEDGSGQRSACSWNFHGSHDGNGRGLSYWVDERDHVHYVWPVRPLGTPVTQELGDALAEGEKREKWERCWLDENRTHVACPDGYRVRVYGQR